MLVKRLVAMAMVAGAAGAAMAMPTKQDLQRAQELVTDVTASDMKALRAKTKKPAEVAAKHMELAAQAGGEAEKFLLLQGAFKLYVKGEDYENAANALTTMSRSISDLNPEVIVEIYNNVIFRSMKDKSPKLYAIKESARRQVFYRAQLVKAEAAVNADPKNVKAQQRLGECHAELGNWQQALEAFSNADGDLAKIAKSEKDGTDKLQVLGDFWWDYDTKSDSPTYKLHAADLYRKALADDSFKGLARTRTEQRIKETEKDAELMAMCFSKADGVGSPRPSTSSSAVLDTAVLTHRWSFAKDFADSVGKVEAKVVGESDVSVKGNQCVCENGGLCLEGVLPESGNDFTVEFWCRMTKIGNGARLIKMGDAPRIGISCDTKKVQFFRNRWGNPGNGGQDEQDLAIDAGHRYYMVVTCSGRVANVYAYDMDGDKRLRQYSHTFESDIKITEDILFGTNWAHPRIMPERKLAYGGVVFDEIRIWRVCKSKEDIEATVKAGPDRIVIPKVHPAPKAVGSR